MTVGENLAQLLFSLMMTGYLFRNAQARTLSDGPRPRAVRPSPAAPAPLPPPTTVPPRAAAQPDGAARIGPGGGENGLLRARCRRTGRRRGGGARAGARAAEARVRLRRRHAEEADIWPGTLSAARAAAAARCRADRRTGGQAPSPGGQVLRWSEEQGVAEIGGREYIDSLEAEVVHLREQVRLPVRQSACPPGQTSACQAAGPPRRAAASRRSSLGGRAGLP